MNRRKWTSVEKSKIIIQSLKGRPVSELCNEHGIAMSQFYQWRDQFLNNADKIFEVSSQSQKESRLERENKRLKGIIGDLTIELKKSEEWL